MHKKPPSLSPWILAVMYLLAILFSLSLTALTVWVIVLVLRAMGVL